MGVGHKLFQLAAPGRLPEWPVFVASLVAMGAIFFASLAFGDGSLRLYLLYTLPLLAIGMQSSRHVLYLTGLGFALLLEALALSLWGVAPAVMAGNLLIEGVVAGLCLSIAHTARSSYLRALDLAGTDDLTGLMNRRAFVQVVDAEIERQARYGGEFSIAMLDLDGFKALNDNHGHMAGDRALRLLAEAIRNNVRRTDSVGRLGGDEFVVLMPNTSQVACNSVCQQLRAAVADAMRDSGYPVTASIGSVTFEQAIESVDVALRFADSAMYQAKQDGGNSVFST